MRNLKFAFLILLLGVLSCDSDESFDHSGNYFPVYEGSEWTFERKIGNALEFHDFGTITYLTSGPVFMDGKYYYRVSRGQVDDHYFYVRRNQAEYFEINTVYFNNTEYKFLDTKKNVGESWEYAVPDYEQRVKYTVVSKNAIQNVKGTVYRNVITIGVQYYYKDDAGEFQPQLFAEHVYAEGVGEVYSYMPYPASLVYGDVKATRIKN